MAEVCCVDRSTGTDVSTIVNLHTLNPGLRPGLVEGAFQAQRSNGVFDPKGRFCQPRAQPWVQGPGTGYGPERAVPCAIFYKARHRPFLTRLAVSVHPPKT